MKKTLREVYPERSEWAQDDSDKRLEGPCATSPVLRIGVAVNDRRIATPPPALTMLQATRRMLTEKESSSPGSALRSMGQATSRHCGTHVKPLQLPPTHCHQPSWPVLGYVACLLLLSLNAPAFGEDVAQLKAQGYVNDFAGVLSEQAKQQLTALCTEVDQKTHAQIAVVTIHTLEGLEAADFANQLFKRWGVGHQDDNRGVLVLLAVADHKYYVEVGYGLEPILPDGVVGGFGREMVPRLRAGDYNGGLLKLTSEIADVIARDRGVALSAMPAQLPPGPVTRVYRLGTTAGFLLMLVFFLFFALVFLGAPAVVIYLIVRGIKGGNFPLATGSSGIRVVRSVHGFTGGGGFSSGGGGFGGGGGGFGGFGGGSSGGCGAGGSW
jgi:uncharacterized protein